MEKAQTIQNLHPQTTYFWMLRNSDLRRKKNGTEAENQSQLTITSGPWITRLVFSQVFIPLFKAILLKGFETAYRKDMIQERQNVNERKGAGLVLRRLWQLWQEGYTCDDHEVLHRHHSQVLDLTGSCLAPTVKGRQSVTEFFSIRTVEHFSFKGR